MIEMTDEHKQLHNWSRQLLEDGRTRRKSFEAQWWEDISTYEGDFWVEYDVVNDALMEPDKADHKVRLPINLARPAVRTEYAKLLKNRPIVDCLAKDTDRKSLNAAEVGDKLLMNYVEKDLRMPKHRRRMLQWVLICGMGGIFVDYDPKAVGEQQVLVGPDGEPVTDGNMVKAIERHYRDKKKAPKTIGMRLGELRHTALSPFQLVYDFSKLDFEEAWWCIVSEVFDVEEVYDRYGVEVEATKKVQPGILERRMLQKWDLTRKLEWDSGDTQKLVEVNRLFVRPGGYSRFFGDQGAEVVFTNDGVIAATVFPYKHKMLPVAVCGHVPLPISQHSRSMLRDIKPLVLEISKTESQLIENRNLMANPPWIEFRQNRVKGEIVNKPGMRLTVDWLPNVPEPHPIEMPEMPQYVQNLIPVLKEHVLEVSGQSEVSQGKVPAGARAGVTIAYLQEEDDTKLGPTVQEYEEAMERVAWLDLQTIAEKYDVPRTVRIFRKHGEPEVFDFHGAMLDGVAGVIVQAGSALPRSKAAKQQFILDLWDRKLEQDPRKVREMLELTQGEPDEWELDVEQAERENRLMAEGKPRAVLEWHNHPAHHYQHRRFMKSADFESLPENVQKLFQDHDEEHTKFEQDQQRQAMVQQMMVGGGSQPAPTTGGANGVTATPEGQFAPPETGFPGGSDQNVQDYAPQ